MLHAFYQKHTDTLKYHLVTAEPPFTVKTIDWMHQTGPRILLSVTHMLCVNEVSHGASRCMCKRWELFFVKPEWKSMDSINGISYYLNKCTRYQPHHRWQSLFAVARPSVVCLSSVCNARAPYSGGSNFRQYFYGIRYIGHKLFEVAY